MTSDSIPSPIAMPTPFAGDTGASVTQVDTGAALDSNVSFRGGFGANYSAPASGGGKYLTREEMNGFGLAMSTDIFRAKIGAVNTFNSAFCEKIGGYPEGAVLDYIVGNKIFKVKSLVNNNTFNFVENGLLGQNKWVALNQDDASGIGDRDILVEKEVAYEAIVSTGVVSIATFQAMVSGTADIEVYDYNDPTGIESISSSINIYYPHGQTFFIKDLGEVLSEYSVPTFSTSTGNWTTNGFIAIPRFGWYGSAHVVHSGTSMSVTYNDIDVRSACRIIAGHYYAVYFNSGVINHSFNNRIDLYTRGMKGRIRISAI